MKTIPSVLLLCFIASCISAENGAKSMDVTNPEHEKLFGWHYFWTLGDSENQKDGIENVAKSMDVTSSEHEKFLMNFMWNLLGDSENQKDEEQKTNLKHRSNLEHEKFWSPLMWSVLGDSENKKDGSTAQM